MHASRCDDLDLYLEEVLDEPHRKEFEEHLSTCFHCQREVHIHRGIDSLLANAARSEPIPPTLIDEVERRMGEASRRRRSLVIGIAAAAATLLLAVGGWMRWRPTQVQKSVPIVESNQSDGGSVIQSETPVREEATPPLLAEVTMESSSDGIVVPLESADSKVAIFWIYPSVSQSTNAFQN